MTLQPEIEGERENHVAGQLKASMCKPANAGMRPCRGVKLPR